LIFGIILLGLVPYRTGSVEIDWRAIQILLFIVYLMVFFEIFLFFRISGLERRRFMLNIIAGSLFGLGSIFQNSLAKLNSGGQISSVSFWIFVITNPFFYFLALNSLSAFSLLQYGLARSKHIAVLIPICSGFTNIVIYIGSIFIFKENVNIFSLDPVAIVRFVSFFLISASTMFIYYYLGKAGGRVVAV
ncbi:MAG: hypothetical protein ACTSXP_13795, partial [Promethearchaeota archaeon]